MVALKLPQVTEEDKAARKAVMQDGLKVAIKVPFSLAETINRLWPTLAELAKVGNVNCKSDLQVGVRCLATAVHGAVHNVEINMKDLDDDDQFVKDTKDAVAKAVADAEKGRDRVLEILAKRDE